VISIKIRNHIHSKIAAQLAGWLATHAILKISWDLLTLTVWRKFCTLNDVLLFYTLSCRARNYFIKILKLGEILYPSPSLIKAIFYIQSRPVVYTPSG